MFGKLEARARARAEAAAARASARLAARIDVPGMRAEAGRAGVTLSGRGLRRRWLADARLRWLGRLLR